MVIHHPSFSRAHNLPDCFATCPPSPPFSHSFPFPPTIGLRERRWKWIKMCHANPRISYIGHWAVNRMYRVRQHLANHLWLTYFSDIVHVDQTSWGNYTNYAISQKIVNRSWVREVLMDPVFESQAECQ